jgi:predicted Zn-dependent protease
MKRVIVCIGVAAVLAVAAASEAQVGNILKKAQQAKDDLTFTDAEEQELGRNVSDMLREKYGVVQDSAVHKYVTLVGRTLASGSARPRLSWTFIVLDTDGVNAFAAPGGYIHITRGALALIQNEAELADVLAHEIIHVTAKHTLNAIRKANLGGVIGDATGSERIKKASSVVYNAVLENKFDRGDEMDSDKQGITLASQAGYAPTGLAAFLTRLADRNKNLKERSGIFASHPESKARIDALGKAVTSQKLTATALVQARYAQSVPFKPVAVGAVAQVAPPSGAAEEKRQGGGGFGLSGLNPLGREKSGSQTVSSAGSRGVNPDRDAKGGPNKNAVAVTVTDAELAAFRKGIVG